MCAMPYYLAGSRCLHDMFRKNEDEGIGKTISKYIPDYHINLIDASNPENVYAILSFPDSSFRTLFIFVSEFKNACTAW